METKPHATPKPARGKIGWRLMLAGFAVILLAGAMYYFAPRSATPEPYRTVGNYLMAGGFLLYVTGRVVRGRVRRDDDRTAA